MGDVDNFLKSVLSIEIYFITFITYFYQIPLRKKKSLEFASLPTCLCSSVL